MINRKAAKFAESRGIWVSHHKGDWFVCERWKMFPLAFWFNINFVVKSFQAQWPRGPV